MTVTDKTMYWVMIDSVHQFYQIKLTSNPYRPQQLVPFRQESIRHPPISHQQSEG
jgi:hypothetical protein